MAAVIHGSRELRNVLQNPAVSREQKLKLCWMRLSSGWAQARLLRNFFGRVD